MGDKRQFGPWHIESEPFNVWDDRGRLIATVHCPLEPDEAWERGCDNARLIAAAPDLLKALKAMLDPMRYEDFEEIEMASSAVEKAEGK